MPWCWKPSIGLAQRLDLDVTAEGIETREQEQYLCGHSVQWGAGLPVFSLR
ncbi:aminoglycoside response regulator [Pseudomonas aeruginosa]|nr:aminoglycoside response regulator [Pseudomonas aeruginosa]